MPPPYELPFILAAASVAMAAGTVSLTGIVEAWQPWWLLSQLPGGGVFLVCGAGARAGAVVCVGGGPPRVAAPAVRHARCRLRDHLRRLHGVHRLALRAVPA